MGGRAINPGFDIIRPPLWGLALALVAGIALIGPRLVVPQTSEFTFLLGALAMALLYLAWRFKGAGVAMVLALPLAAVIGWDGYFSDWWRLLAFGSHAAVSLVLYVVVLGLWWRWIGVRLPIGRFVLVTVVFSAAGLVAAWINSQFIETRSLESGQAQLELIGRNLLLGAAFSLGLEIGEWRRRREES